ncbi:MAG: glycosyltransferase family 9 protein [Bacteroidetes bacterium]|nr:glycosyltransferase family 9 protein [Bacteroidota bacterium]
MTNEKWLYFCNILLSRLINAGRSQPIIPRRILCVKWDEMGDMAVSVHVFELLKKQFPAAEIHVLCKPAVVGLIANDPHIDKILSAIEEWKEPYDLVVELRGTWKTLWKSLRSKTMPKYRLDRGWIRFRQRKNQPHEVLSNYRIIAPLLGSGDGFDITNTLTVVQPRLHPSAHDIVLAQDWVADLSQPTFAIIHSGARSALRRWAPERFIALSQWLLAEKNLLPVWIGTPDEEPYIEAMLSAGGSGVKWIAGNGKSDSLLALYAFIEKSSLYVGNESGPLQLADIAGVPLLAIVGPGVPNVFYPRSLRSRVLHEILECNPCDQIHCVRLNDPCIDKISVLQVKNAVESVLA